MSDLRTPLKRAIGLGSARYGAHHFIAQRITAVALAILAIWFVWLVLSALHADYTYAHALVARPWNALLMIAFTVTMFWHAQLGLQVVIEDYVTTRAAAVVLQLLVRFGCVLGAGACVLAVLRIALGR